jgi:proline iminopeptidase
MKKSSILLLVAAIFFLQCTPSQQNEIIETDSYLDFSERDDQYEGGIKMIPISTPKGEFKIWTKRVGNNPKMKVLLLHGGPGMTHELYSCFDGYFPAEGIEFIYYDQLGSYYSDQPEDQELWTIDRFVDEVEQVRIALGLDKNNFYLFGQSWGGMLAMEYALKHQDKLKGLVISNMMSSLDEYEKYAKEVLGPQMPDEVFQEIMKIEEEEDFENPRYEELLMEHHYQDHVLRKPIAEWPEAILRTLKHVNPNVYVYMQGYSEFGITASVTSPDDCSECMFKLKNASQETSWFSPDTFTYINGLSSSPNKMLLLISSVGDTPPLVRLMGSYIYR